MLRFITIFLVLSCITEFIHGQDSYNLLDDPTGLNPTSFERSQLEAATDSLIGVLPLAYQSQFKVYEGGIYPLTSYIENGIEINSIKLLSQIPNSGMSLGLIRIYDKNTIRWKVNLFGISSIPGFDCEEDTEVDLEKKCEGILSLDPTHSGKLQVLRYLKARFNKIVTCYTQNGNQCDLPCLAEANVETIKYELIGNGFKRHSISNVTIDSSWNDGNHKIFDYANKRFTLNGAANVSIPLEIEDSKIIFDASIKSILDSSDILIIDTVLEASIIDTTEFKGVNFEYSPNALDFQYISGGMSIPPLEVPSQLKGHVYILDELCWQNGRWNNVKQLFSSDTIDYVEVWVILNEGNGNYGLYSRYYLTDLGGVAVRPGDTTGIETRSSFPTSPMQAALQILGNAAIDAFFQTVFIYLTDESAKTFGEAFGKISITSAAWEGVSSLLPWKSVTGWKAQLGKAALDGIVSGLATVIEKSKKVANYTVQEGCKDFLISFGSSILTTFVGSKLIEGGAKMVSGAAKWTFNSGILGELGCLVFRMVGVKYGCFPAGTLIMTGPGSYVPIEDIQLFQPVISYKNVNILPEIENGEEVIYQEGETFKYDPYVSYEQLYRDGSDLEEQWYEIGIRDQNGRLKGHVAWTESIMGEYEVNKPGDVISMIFMEMGVAGDFKVTSTKHAIPQKIPEGDDLDHDYSYNAVTGIFTHIVDQLLVIHFENGDTLTVTPNHPIFSPSKKNWFPASSFKKDDVVKSYQGELKITDIQRLTGKFTVYNLEVKNVHNFLVGKSGVLVHNSCWNAVNSFLGRDLATKKRFIGWLWKYGWVPRGVFTEKLLSKIKYTKAKDWIPTGPSYISGYGLNDPSFPLIDFYRKLSSGKHTMVSVKTTTSKNVNAWMNSNKKHLIALSDKVGGEISKGNKKLPTADFIQVHIYTKFAFSQAEKQAWQSALIAKYPKINSFVIETIEENL